MPCPTLPACTKISRRHIHKYLHRKPVIHGHLMRKFFQTGHLQSRSTCTLLQDLQSTTDYPRSYLRMSLATSNGTGQQHLQSHPRSSPYNSPKISATSPLLACRPTVPMAPCQGCFLQLRCLLTQHKTEPAFLSQQPPCSPIPVRLVRR
jgi:hypothetical protein